METNWDLYAIVRPYTTTITSSSSSSIPTTITTTPTSSYSRFQTLTSSNFFPLYPTEQVLSLPHHLNNIPRRVTSAATRVSKRRNYGKKIQPKKVWEVKANVSSDIWAWRKYGQKIIKGSPYPREYYRCSGSKWCLAKKQVQRSKSDTTVIYIDDHNHRAPTHRNSLVASTRQKPLLPQTFTDEFSSLSFGKQFSPPTSGAEEKNATLLSELVIIEDLEDLMNDDDWENKIESEPDMVITDDFFEGLGELPGFSNIALPESESEMVISDDFFESLGELPGFSSIALPESESEMVITDDFFESLGELPDFSSIALPACGGQRSGHH